MHKNNISINAKQNIKNQGKKLRHSENKGCKERKTYSTKHKLLSLRKLKNLEIEET